MDDNSQPTYWIRPENHSASDATVEVVADNAANDYGLLTDLCELTLHGKTGDFQFKQLNDTIYGRLLATYPPSEEERQAA